MERDYLEVFGGFSVDALALVLLAQRARDVVPNGHERPRFGGRAVKYSGDSTPCADYRGSRTRYNIKQPTNCSRR